MRPEVLVISLLSLLALTVGCESKSEVSGGDISIEDDSGLNDADLRGDAQYDYDVDESLIPAPNAKLTHFRTGADPLEDHEPGGWDDSKDF